MNYPVLDIAATFNGNTYITGTFNSAPNAIFTLQFFANAISDPSKFGQGESLIDTTTVTTDSNGNASFSVSIPGTILAGTFVSATATDSNGDTSEFSYNSTVFASGGLVVAVNHNFGLFANSVITESAPGVLAGDYDLTGQPLTCELVQTSTHGTLSLQSDGAFVYTPDPGFIGTDTFTYEDTDGTDTSNVATVSLYESPVSLAVTNTNDSGPGSFRNALLSANLSTSSSAAKILFEIPGTGPFSIQLDSPLPAITHPTVIDGYDQAGATPNTLAQGDNAIIMIALIGDGYDGLDLVAGDSTVKGLAIVGSQNLIHLQSAGGDTITGNFLGTTVPQGYENADYVGILVDGSSGNKIGGTSPSDRNVIDNSATTAIWLTNGSAGNAVEGNWFGVNTTGSSLPLDYGGVEITDSPSNTIGGAAAGAGNVFAALRGSAVTVNSSTGAGQGSPRTVIQGNLIGTDPTGETAVYTGIGEGIALNAGADTTIGGTATGARNVIASCDYGIDIGSLAPDTVILGNLIGTDAAGTKSLSNYDGIVIEAGTAGTVIGGSSKGDGNVISGNRAAGISDLYPSLGQATLIQGNLIGTDVSGTLPLPNRADGIDVGDNNDTIGGTAAAARNVISANTGAGIALSASGVLIEGNDIGTDSSGTQDLGNGQNGISVSGSNNTIGGTTTKAGNVIAFNDQAGVGVLTGATGVAILTNSIFSNSGLGIDLGEDGVTLNTPGGPHTGANNLQNSPVLVTAITYDGKTYLKGTFNSTADEVFTIQFFANPTSDPSGYGQGHTYLGQASVATDNGGNASFEFSFPVVATGDPFLSATATDQSGNTSEFAADIPIAFSSKSVYAAPDHYHVDLNSSLVVAAPGVHANDIATNGESFHSILIGRPAHGKATLNPDGSFSYTPNTGFIGTDAFTYADVQGSTRSNITTVTISVSPKTFTVTNLNATGPGSLFQAMLNANLATSPAPDTINFNIPGTGPFTITPQTALPALTHPTIINGYSQPGSSPNTLTAGDNAVVEIQLNGYDNPSLDGLMIVGGGSTIKGLDIFGFTNEIHLEGSGQDLISGDLIGFASGTTASAFGNVGVFIDGVPANSIGGTTPASRNVISGNAVFGVNVLNSTGDLIEGNFIGTDTTGAIAFANGVGVNLENSSSCTIGAASIAAGNVISGNNQAGIQLTDTGNILIESNLIGTDVTGTQPLGNASAGVDIGPNTAFPSPTSTIDNNVISANGDGVLITGAGDNVIQANFIGTDRTGTMSLGNTQNGVIVDDPGSDTIGGTTQGAGNIIAFNQLAGVDVEDNAVGVEVLSNSIFSNGGLGIELDDAGVAPPGPNNLQASPVLTSAVSSGGKTTIAGTLTTTPSTHYLIQFFANVSADPSGSGQGQLLLGTISVTTDSSGNISFTATFSTTVPPGEFISATVTDPAGDTSEFAQDVVVTA